MVKRFLLYGIYLTRNNLVIYEGCQPAGSVFPDIAQPPAAILDGAAVTAEVTLYLFAFHGGIK